MEFLLIYGEKGFCYCFTMTYRAFAGFIKPFSLFKYKTAFPAFCWYNSQCTVTFTDGLLYMHKVIIDLFLRNPDLAGNISG